MSSESTTEIWTYCTQRDVVPEHYRNRNLLHQRNVVRCHYRNLNLLHWTRCRLRALQKSELIALNEMSFESITEIWTYCTQRDVVWEHYRNLNVFHSTIWRLRDYRNLNLLHSTRCHYRNLNLLHSTRCRLRALQKSERISLNEMSFGSITEIWTYCTQRGVVWEHYRNLKYHSTNVWEHYRNLNLLHSTRCRLRALQKSELIALNEMSFESITEIWNLRALLNLLHSTRCRSRALQKS